MQFPTQISRRVRALVEAVAPGVQPVQGGVSIDEVRLVDAMLRDRHGAQHVLVDVGAHHGGTLAPFARRGWTVHAFEPDSKNREQLTKAWGQASNVRIDPRAVAAEAAENVVLYRAETSTGISALSAFHQEHVEGDQVDVTTLSDHVEASGLDTIDVLKIDVEGHDLAVLRGHAWDRILPEVVVAEFEDAKTRPLGHGWRDIAEFLETRGYVVVVSEWFPIAEYGRRHRHRRLAPWPTELVDPLGWGNLIAFRTSSAARAFVRRGNRARRVASVAYRVGEIAGHQSAR